MSEKTLQYFVLKWPKKTGERTILYDLCKVPVVVLTILGLVNFYQTQSLEKNLGFAFIKPANFPPHYILGFPAVGWDQENIYASYTGWSTKVVVPWPVKNDKDPVAGLRNVNGNSCVIFSINDGEQAFVLENNSQWREAKFYKNQGQLSDLRKTRQNACE